MIFLQKNARLFMEFAFEMYLLGKMIHSQFKKKHYETIKFPLH